MKKTLILVFLSALAFGAQAAETTSAVSAPVVATPFASVAEVAVVGGVLAAVGGAVVAPVIAVGAALTYLVGAPL